MAFLKLLYSCPGKGYVIRIIHSEGPAKNVQIQEAFMESHLIAEEMSLKRDFK